jgi:hypothetical protein
MSARLESGYQPDYSALCIQPNRLDKRSGAVSQRAGPILLDPAYARHGAEVDSLALYHLFRRPVRVVTFRLAMRVKTKHLRAVSLADAATDTFVLVHHWFFSHRFSPFSYPDGNSVTGANRTRPGTNQELPWARSTCNICRMAYSHYNGTPSDTIPQIWEIVTPKFPGGSARLKTIRPSTRCLTLRKLHAILASVDTGISCSAESS